ncbi:MAG TPA: VTT domain-containing protein [Blastocatellia bacterium]|jgi:membrane protein YqaA with SNARE-associated domain|nr:VTT domain-containing protein [Blastocatellia bacterium]
MLFRLFRGLGGWGLFLMGVLDSSFLFLPFGNDLLLIAMVSADREGLQWIYYVIMSALGSVVGVLLVDLIMRKAGEEGLQRFVNADKVERLKCKMEKRGGWAVFLATLIPPPFPFTAVVLTASALQCARKKVLAAVFFGRLIRFSIEAALAIYFGRRILRLMNSDVIEYFVYGLILIAIVGSIFSIRKWLGTRRGKPAMQTSTASD